MKVSLEEQLEVLDSCGIRLEPDVTIEHLLASFDRESYEKKPYELLLVMMGAELEVEPFTYASNNIWHFDTECIEDHGDYSSIAHRMCDLTEGALKLINIEDYVDIEEDTAWLSFELSGKNYKWIAKVEDDWIDTDIISSFVELLDSLNVGKRFTYFDLGGQDCLIGCSTQKQLEQLKAKTGLNFEWLT